MKKKIDVPLPIAVRDEIGVDDSDGDDEDEFGIRHGKSSIPSTSTYMRYS